MAPKSKYSQKLATEICKRLAHGESLRAICSEDGMPHRDTVFGWLFRFKSFADQYARAQEARMDTWAEEIVEISDDNSRDEYEVTDNNGHTRTIIDHDTINRSRLRVDARKWVMSKLSPRKYGDRAMPDSGGANLPPVFELRVTGQGERIKKEPGDD